VNPILPHLSSSYSFNNLFFVKGITPIVLKISESNDVLIFLSKGELDEKLGKTLTSRSHGFSS
jgi:hypothetical protein